MPWCSADRWKPRGGVGEGEAARVHWPSGGYRRCGAGGWTGGAGIEPGGVTGAVMRQPGFGGPLCAARAEE
jgi:hypothetical protein